MATMAVDQQWPIELVHRTGVCRERAKTDVAEHAEAFHHVGLLVNGSPGRSRLPFI